jgi:glycosyltransferase involved in cell wall biosynthesis
MSATRVLHATQSMASGGAASGIRGVIASLCAPQFEHVVVVESMSAAERAATPPGVGLHAVAAGPGVRWVRRLVALRQLIEQLRIGVVHARGWPGTDALLAAASLPQVALVLSAHGRQAAQARRRTWPQRTVLRWLGRRLDGAFGVTPELAAELARDLGWSPSKVAVILNAVDMTRFAPAPPEPAAAADATLRVGVAGRLVAVKRHDLVLDMAEHVLRAHGAQALRVEIAGEGPLSAALEAEVKRRGLQDHVFLRGQVPDMVRWYQGIDVFVSCSDFEGCSNVVLEALACAVPVIATDVGVNRSLLDAGRGGLVVPPGNADALADAVSRLLDDRPLATRLGREGRRLLEQRQLSRARADAYARLYGDALGHRRAPQPRRSTA